MLRRKSKTQLVKQERNTQNAIAHMNYLKRIATQQLPVMLRMQKIHIIRFLQFARNEPGSSDCQALDLTTTL
jgi:hypothetical protein